MVDWDKVQELRSKGWDWGDIAKDPAVDFHPDASAGDPGRALRALYHRSGRRTQKTAAESAAPKRPSKEEAERKWTLTRIGYLAVPTVGIWFLLAYVAPSPVGIIVPAIPYLALVLAGVAFLLIYALWRRTEGRRWTAVYRRTVVVGVVLGIVVAGAIGLAGSVIFGCPYLPPSSSLSTNGASGWESGSIAAWHQNGVPVVFFYGATWCPYCSASSWAVYKALTEFSNVTGVTLDFSAQHDVYPGTPEAVLANAHLGPKKGNGPGAALLVAEDTSGVDGTYPPTASCYEQAYVSAYAAGIPFVVLNGQYVHVGTIVNPASLAPWNSANTSGSGAATVRGDVLNETGAPWSAVQSGTWWIMAYLAKDLGYSSTTVGVLVTDYGWTTADKTNVVSDLQSLGS
ncbi:MAG TPA: DUF929 family protein [Thermoplasmata archaeon]|nr:DUF929 family protein [Thermoplasmata archaeon]